MNQIAFEQLLNQIIIPSSVTSIGEGASYKFSSLAQLSIHSSVTLIGGYAFKGCSSFVESIQYLEYLVQSIKINDNNYLIEIEDKYKPHLIIDESLQNRCNKKIQTRKFEIIFYHFTFILPYKT